MSEIVVRSGKKDSAEFKEVKFVYDIGTGEDDKISLDKALKIFGKEIVTSMYTAGMIVAVQNPARQILAAGTQEEYNSGKLQQDIKDFMSKWIPGVRVPRAAVAHIDPIESIMKQVESGELSQEKINEIIADLQSKVGGSTKSKK